MKKRPTIKETIKELKNYIKDCQQRQKDFPASKEFWRGKESAYRCILAKYENDV